MRVDPRRHSLARSQATLMRALASREPVPDGFREDRVRIAGESLLRKRCRTVALVAPGVALQSGDEFVRLFLDYASRHPLPEKASGRYDATMFVRWLADRRGRATDVGAIR